MQYGVLITNYNGAAIIERCLTSVSRAVEKADVPIDIAVVDDSSSDSSLELIAAQFPQVEIISTQTNSGFGAALNHGMASLGSDSVFVLNNDIAVEPDYFLRAIKTHVELNTPNLFCIGMKTVQWETGEPNHEGMRARFVNGMITQIPFECDTVERADFFQAGACLIDRKKYLELGGCARIFYPAYWEDYDVAYQALRRGWDIYYEPRAVAIHWGKWSMDAAYGTEAISLMLKRNHIFLNWVNLRDPKLLLKHLLGLPRLMIRGDASGSKYATSWAKAMIGALERLPEVLAERKRRNPLGNGVSDREILQEEERTPN